MGSNYLGEPNYIAGQMSMNGKGGFLSPSPSSTSLSSRKGKKNGSDKPQQPQRGLGVAQLEKNRLHSQLGCAYLPSHHGPNNPYEAHMRLDVPHSLSSPSYYSYYGIDEQMKGLPDLNMEDATYGDSQFSNISRWDQGNSGFGSTEHYVEAVEPSMSTRSFFDQGSLTNNQSESMDLMGSTAHNSESLDIDLELRL